MPRHTYRPGKPGKWDPKSEIIREKHGHAYDNYGTVNPTPDKTVENNKTAG